MATVAQLTDRIQALDAQLRRRVLRQAPGLLNLPGIGVLIAAKLRAETANPARFRSEACFAMHAGSRRSRPAPAGPNATGSTAAATGS